MSKESFRKFLEENEGKPMKISEFFDALIASDNDEPEKKKKSKSKAEMDFRKFHLEPDDDRIHVKYGDYYVIEINDKGAIRFGSNLPEEFETDEDGLPRVR